ncbi:hypothetical protein Dimus_008029 [Dionaea muscipula]
MDLDIDRKDICATLTTIADNKAPGMDRFTDCVFKQSWSVVGDDVHRAILDFFTNGKMLTRTLIQSGQCVFMGSRQVHDEARLQGTRGHHEKVPWEKMVWNGDLFPRHQVIHWSALKNKWSTVSRLAKTLHVVELTLPGLDSKLWITRVTKGVLIEAGVVAEGCSFRWMGSLPMSWVWCVFRDGRGCGGIPWTSALPHR